MVFAMPQIAKFQARLAGEFVVPVGDDDDDDDDDDW